MSHVAERIIPLLDFARAMREEDAVFAQRVQAFEERFGPASDDSLSVLAQAAYLCWFEGEFEDDLLSTCKAIGTGRPTHLYLCSQITPARWNLLNAYVVAVQQWRGVEAALPGNVDTEHIRQIVSWLGDREPGRAALVDLLLAIFVYALSERISLSRLASSSIIPDRHYADYSDWYACLSVEEASAAANRALGDGATDLISGMEMPGEPPCHFRWARYLDIKVCSIGALKWRGNLPTSSAPKKPKQRLWADLADAFRDWLEGSTPSTATAERVHGALGERTDWKESVVRDLLTQPPPGTAFYDWITKRSAADGLTPTARFGLGETE